jgi:hypothetical protein
MHRRAAQGFAAMIPDTKNGLPANGMPVSATEVHPSRT